MCFDGPFVPINKVLIVFKVLFSMFDDIFRLEITSLASFISNYNTFPLI